MEETEEYTNKWKDILHSQTGRINIAKMSIPFRAIHEFNEIPTKISMSLFTETEQTVLKCVQNHKDSEQAKRS